MLIITRKPGEKIMLGDDVTVEVIEISGSSVRIGIDAPRSVPVYREEIWAAVKAENAAAADAAPAADEVKPPDPPKTRRAQAASQSSPPPGPSAGRASCSAANRHSSMRARSGERPVAAGISAVASGPAKRWSSGVGAGSGCGCPPAART